MAKFGLPVYPIYDEMTIEATQTREELEWLLEHGEAYRSLRHFCELRTIEQSQAGLPLYWQCVTKHQGKYAFIAYDEVYQGDDPQPEHYVLRQYETLDALMGAEHITFTERGLMTPWWKWFDSKPDLFSYLEAEVMA